METQWVYTFQFGSSIAYDSVPIRRAKRDGSWLTLNYPFIANIGVAIYTEPNSLDHVTILDK